MARQLTFKDLPIGQTFDFVSEQPFSSFARKCTKVSARCYTWRSGDNEDGPVMRSQVGRIGVAVYHVGRE